MDRIVVGVNGSPASTAAALWAAGEAAMRDIELTIVHVLATPPEPCSRMEWPTTPLPSEATNAVVAQGVDVVDQTLDAVARRIGRQPPRITSQLCFGPVVPTLWEFTQQGPQMIALGRHSRGNILRARMSSVTNEMLQTARCPVAVVPQNADSRVRARRAPVVVGIDRQPACQLAIAVAFDEAARRSAELVAVHAVPCSDSSGETHARGNAKNREAEYALTHALADWQLRYPNIVVRRLVTPHDPVQALLSHSRRAQLTVVGGGRHSSFGARPFSGVSSAVAQTCPIPLIVARRKPPGCQAETIGIR
jgi:nucleotide-binding universal stress UspA family protein